MFVERRDNRLSPPEVKCGVRHLWKLAERTYDSSRAGAVGRCLLLSNCEEMHATRTGHGALLGLPLCEHRQADG